MNPTARMVRRWHKHVWSPEQWSLANLKGGSPLLAGTGPSYTTTCRSMPAAHLLGRLQVKFLVPGAVSCTSAGVAVMSASNTAFSAPSQELLVNSATLCCPGVHLNTCTGLYSHSCSAGLPGL